MRGLVIGVFLIGCTANNPATMEPDPGPVGPAAAKVTRNGAPVAGATVVFGDVDGAVIETATTDAAGAAASTADVSTITVIDPAQTTRLFSIIHVRPGDPIEIPLDPAVNEPGPTLAMLDVAAPPGPLPGGTDHIMIHLACTAFEVASLPATVAVPTSCLGADGNVPVVVEADSPAGSLENPGGPLATVIGLASSATGGHFAFAPAATWSTACDRAVSVKDATMSVQLWQQFDGLPFRNASAAFCAPPTPAPGYAEALPTLPLDDGLTAFAFGYLTTEDHMVFATTAYPTTPATIDFLAAPGLLEGVAPLASFDETGVTFTPSADLASADATIALLSYQRGTDTFVRWTVAAPGDARAAALPALPAALDTYDLAHATGRFGELHFVDATWLSDLASTQRALPALLYTQEPTSQLPAGGTVREYREQYASEL